MADKVPQRTPQAQKPYTIYPQPSTGRLAAEWVDPRTSKTSKKSRNVRLTGIVAIILGLITFYLLNH